MRRTLTAMALVPLTAGAAAQRPPACTDFCEHVNGDWLARTELPPDRARIGSFDERWSSRSAPSSTRPGPSACAAR